jgi:CRP-like cAMP-binding protein
MDQLRIMKDEAARAMGRGQWQQALKLYQELARREPSEGTWALRAGDAARRLGDSVEAVSWYEQAVAAYAKRGLVVRAIAVGKMIESIDPGNDRSLRELDASRPGSALACPSHGASVHSPVGSEPQSGSPRQVAGRPNIVAVQNPPLMGRLSGPLLAPAPAHEATMTSVEIVFDDADDGLPIRDESLVAVEACMHGHSDPGASSSLPSFPIFEVLPPGTFLTVVSRLKHVAFNAGEVIVRQGDRGKSLFAVIDGQAIVYLDGQKESPLATLEPGSVFGEMALALDRPRAATVEAVTAVEAFEMDREVFRAVIDQHPEFADVLSRMIKRRLVENVMVNAPMFKQFDQDTRQELMARFEVREVAPGTRLVEEGARSDGLYLLVSGLVYARRGEGCGSEPPTIVAIIKPGQAFGTASLLDARHASSTSFEAPESAVVLRLPRAAFHEVISAYPPVLEHVAEIAEAQQAWGVIKQLPVV